MNYGGNLPSDPELASDASLVETAAKPLKARRQRRPDRTWRKRNAAFNGMHRRRKRRVDW